MFTRMRALVAFLCCSVAGAAPQFEPVSRAVGSDFAVLTTKSLYQDTVDGKPYRSRSWVTFTFRKEAGQWRLIHDQNTRLPPQQQ